MEARKAVGYLRVSTDSQAQEGLSIEAQEAKVRAYCALHDLILVDICRDAGISGKSALNRPGLQEALRIADTGAVLIVYSLSRLARSTVDSIQIAERLQSAGSDLVSLSEQIDTTTAAGRLFFRLMAVLAEFERELTVERIKTVFDHKRSRNERLGMIPYGWQLGADGKTLEPSHSERRTLDLIRQYHSEGDSLRAIARRLAGEGVLARTGRPFAPSTLKSLLDQAV